MRDRYATSSLAAILLVCSLPVGASQPPARAALDTVIPAGPRNPSSGAPAAWQEPMRDNAIHSLSAIDRLEYGTGDGPGNYLWDVYGWVGGDINRFWWKTEGEGLTSGGSPESTTFQASYGRAITPFWNALAGVRYDLHPGDDRTFGMLKLRGLAPLFIDTEASFFVSDHGVPSVRGEFEYEVLISQRLRLAPRAEINVGARDADYELGGGLQNSELGLRLKYQVMREFAPYIGVRWEQQYGDTRDLARAQGEADSATAFVVGLSAWY